MPTVETAPATTLFLEQMRIIRAPRTRVYEAWTNPEVLKKWFGTAEMYCPVASLDARVDGEYRVEMLPTPEAIAAKPEMANRGGSASGSYTKVIPNELLQFTWNPTWNPGELSLVTVLFEDARGGTQVTIRHERFTSEQSREGHNNGWAGGLDKLTALLEN
jgi:uncharacterized protein YndB with AHSA1/START domain